MAQARLDQVGFEGQAHQALRRVRAAITDLVAPLAGKRTARTSELVEVLGLDTRLAWKLVKIIEREDALTTVRYLPGSRGLRLLLRAAARCNAPKAAMDELTRAFRALDEFVRREAGDRKSFGMMVSDQAGALRQDANLEHRKGAFDHNGYIWGVQARAQVHSYIFQPAADGAHLDVAIIRGFIGLRRIRSGIPWRISRFFSIDDLGQVRGEFMRSALDPACADKEVPLLRDFCVPTDPPVQRIVGPLGVVDYVLAETDVGNTQSVTCLTGELIRNAEPCYPTERYGALSTKAPLRTPCQMVVFDLYLHRGFFGRIALAARLVSDLFVESLGVGYTDTDRLPLSESVEHLGSGPETPPVPELPSYPGMIGYCFERLGWPAEEFDCYRLLLPFPPMPCALLVDCPLPARPL